jgi:hypothetical protein
MFGSGQSLGRSCIIRRGEHNLCISFTYVSGSSLLLLGDHNAISRHSRNPSLGECFFIQLEPQCHAAPAKLRRVQVASRRSSYRLVCEAGISFRPRGYVSVNFGKTQRYVQVTLAAEIPVPRQNMCSAQRQEGIRICKLGVRLPLQLLYIRRCKLNVVVVSS